MMKHARYILYFILCLYIASCAPDKKDDPLQPTNTDDRDKYVGTWTCNENSQIAGQTSYNITIAKSTSNSGEIIINNFYQLNTSARATVNGNSFTIPYQQLGSVGFASGSGNLTGSSSINMTYYTDVASTKDTCTANCSKQ